MWIWQAQQWPNFRFDAQALQPSLAAARLAQGRLLGMASQLQLIVLSDLQIDRLRDEAVATAQIEGDILHPQSVRASAARRLGLVPALKPSPCKPTRKNFKRDRRAPAREEATLDVLQAAHNQWQQPLSQTQLLDWHAMLFPGKDYGLIRIPVGCYRSHAQAMQIVTPQIDREDIVHYQAPPSLEVPRQMRRLIDWFNQSQDKIDGLVRAALAHLWLEAIHPFEDGNGRIGRALSDLALAQDSRSNQPLFSLSAELLRQRSGYYAQLQATTGRGRLEVSAWVQWFVQRIQAACERSIETIDLSLQKNRYWAAVHAAHPSINASQTKVLTRLLLAQTQAPEQGFIGGLSTEKYVALTGLSRATAYREISQLFAAGLLHKTGQGRATRYQLPD